jgi:hypothetical protein
MLMARISSEADEGVRTLSCEAHASQTVVLIVRLRCRCSRIRNQPLVSRSLHKVVPNHTGQDQYIPSIRRVVMYLNLPFPALYTTWQHS